MISPNYVWTDWIKTLVLVATDRSHRALMEKMVYTYFLDSNTVTIFAEIVFRSAFCNF